MNYKYFDIGSKKIRVNFLSSGMGSSDYNVELCGMTSRPGTRVKKSHDSGAIEAREWGCRDAGITTDEAVTAVNLFLAGEHSDYLAWFETLSPEMRLAATA